MYSESDIEAAVAAGAMTPEAAAALRAHAFAKYGTSVVDEENIRLVTSFNDIFVTIACILVLAAMGSIAATIGTAITAWALAEYFTRKRHMALPSIVLLITFAVSVFLLALAILQNHQLPTSYRYPDLGSRINDHMIFVAAAAGITSLATYAHWRRFRVPITIAAGTLALSGLAVSLLMAAIPDSSNAKLVLTLITGLAIFAFAMWWDMSDRTRVTRNSDVAFWLHLAAAPMIVHPIFWLLGLLNGEAGIAQALIVLVIYCLMGVVALTVDRRALLVSALFYVLYALGSLIRQFGSVHDSFTVTALLIGSALLLLSAFWHRARARIVNLLPDDWQARLPALNR